MNDYEAEVMYTDHHYKPVTCIFCGTEVGDDNYCYECDETANDMGLDYNELKESF